MLRTFIISLLVCNFLVSACSTQPDQEFTNATETGQKLPDSQLEEHLPTSRFETAIPSETQTMTKETEVISQEGSRFDAGLLGTVQRDIPYCETQSSDFQLMDIHYPENGQAPFPTVVYVHGGSWVSGDKSEGNYILDRTRLVEGGNIFVTINYRLAPETQFPGQIEDVKCAVRSLRANAGQLGIDPDRIAAMGSSAGGHLVSLLGTSDASAGWDSTGPYQAYSSRVNAVVDLFGPIVPEGELTPDQMKLLSQVFGAQSLNDPILVKASPVNHITPDDPPFLILHGTLDDTVPLSQSQRFIESLQTGGIDAQLIIVEGAGHGIPGAGVQTRPTYPETMQVVKDFLQRTIGRRS